MTEFSSSNCHISISTDKCDLAVGYLHHSNGTDNIISNSNLLDIVNTYSKQWHWNSYIYGYLKRIALQLPLLGKNKDETQRNGKRQEQSG